jgi:hypothetical protein
VKEELDIDSGYFGRWLTKDLVDFFTTPKTAQEADDLGSRENIIYF